MIIMKESDDEDIAMNDEIYGYILIKNEAY